MLEIEARQLGQFFVLAMPLHFAPRQRDQPVKIALVAHAQQLVVQHRNERRRDRHRELERHAVAHEPVHHFDERNVSLGDGFEEPVLFVEFFVLRMPDERQMRVQD